MPRSGRGGSASRTVAVPIMRGVDRDLPGVVGDHQHAPGGQVLDAVRLDAEVVAVEEREDDQRAPRDVDVESPRIVAVAVELERRRRRSSRISWFSSRTTCGARLSRMPPARLGSPSSESLSTSATAARSRRRPARGRARSMMARGIRRGHGGRCRPRASAAPSRCVASGLVLASWPRRSSRARPSMRARC